MNRSALFVTACLLLAGAQAFAQGGNGKKKAEKADDAGMEELQQLRLGCKGKLAATIFMPTVELSVKTRFSALVPTAPARHCRALRK